MFRRHAETTYADLSIDLLDAEIDWSPGTLREFEYPADITSVAILPTSLIAIGTSHGSVHIYGRPGVETRLDLDEPISIKLLQFAPSSYQLICVDEVAQLHVWDLRTYGKPKMISNTLFPYSINSLTVSPSHNHVFVGLDHTGEIRTFDLQCLRKSPYTVPNLWKLHLKKLAASGALAAQPGPASATVLNVHAHPRDLNLLFVVYLGGIVLYSIAEKAAIRVYELELAPGAPGGAGYGNKEILTHRRPGVTSFAIHPSGHFFVVGHDDGCLSFWAVEDEDQPLLVRTVDEIDVNRLDAERLDKHMNNPSGIVEPPREPIFKVSWSGFSNSSDPRGGATSLAILGGLINPENGLTAFWLPPFNPPEPSEPDQGSSFGYWSHSMRESLLPQKSYFYSLPWVPQDFFLVPKESPHFEGTFDPMAILFLLQTPSNARVVQAFAYPPPIFSSSNDQEGTSVDSGGVEDDLEATLRDLSLNSDAKALRLPSPIQMQSGVLLDADILTVDQDEYSAMLNLAHGPTSDVSLDGGFAWSDESRASELKLSKYQPHRFLITKHRDLTVQFHDLSASLLVGLKPSPIKNDFPQPLPGLTLKLNTLLSHPAVLSKGISIRGGIQSVLFASEAQEVAVIFHSGEIAAYRISSNIASPSEGSPDPELILLQGWTAADSLFEPYFLLAMGRGAPTACALSDIGFLAASFADGTLAIVDMRGPRIIFKSGFGKDKRQSIFHAQSQTVDSVVSLNWIVCRTDNDSQLRLRLLAVTQSSSAQLCTIMKTSDNSWTVKPDSSNLESASHPLPQGSFVFDLKTGKPLRANRSMFARSLGGDSEQSPFAWLSVGRRSARCTVGFSGDRIGKADWTLKLGSSTVLQVQIVERLGSYALSVFTDQNDVLVYSLPHLEFLHRIPSPVLTSLLTVDSSGDMIAWIKDATSGETVKGVYGTFFTQRRAYNLPDIDLSPSKPVVPLQPAPVSIGPTSFVGSWINKFTDKSVTGAQIDVMLGGPGRPIITATEDETQFGTAASERASATAESVSQNVQATQANLSDRLNAAMGERSQMLGDLEEHFSSLQTGTQNMVEQAKRLATQQTIRSRFGF